MKLRLPKTLLAALLVAVTNFPVSTYADYVWNGGDNITAELWATESSWSLTDDSTWSTTGSGPTTPDSNMWNTLIINGASGTIDCLEGWNFHLNLGVAMTNGVASVGEASTLTIGNIKKFQTKKDSNEVCEINIGKGSTLNISRGVENYDGNSNAPLNINFIEGGTVNLTSGIYGTGSNHSITVNYGSISDSDLSGVGSFNLAYTQGETYAYTLTALTLTATITDSVSSEETTLHTIELGTVATNIGSALVYDITATDYIESSGILTADTSNIGKYSIVHDADGKVTLYYVTGSFTSLVWNATENNNTIDTDSTNWLNGDTPTSYRENVQLVFDGTSAVKTVILNGTDIDVAGITVNEEYTFEVIADTAISAGTTTLAEGASVTKNGSADLTVTSNVLEGLQINITEGSITVSDALKNGSTLDLSNGSLSQGATLTITASSGDDGSSVKLADDASGTLRLAGGLLHISGENTSLGNATLSLSDGSGLVAVNYETAANFSNKITIDDNATITLQAWGTSHDGIIGSNITGGSNSNVAKIDGGTFTLSGAISITNLNVENGTLNLTGTANISGIISGKGGSRLNLNSGANVTASQIRLNDASESDCTITINSDAVLTITGSNNDHSTDASILLGHWLGNNSALIINGGTLQAENAEVHLAWAGSGTFTINSGTASVLGINYWAQNYAAFGGTVNLGSAENGDGTLIIGANGINNLASGGTLNLGKGTLQANEDFSICYNTAYTESVVNLIGKDDGTIFDTNGHTITVSNTMSGDGNITVTGTGTLAINSDVTLGKLTIREGATLTTAEDKDLTISTTIINNGTLSIGGSLIIADTDLPNTGSGISFSDATLSDTQNGYAHGTWIIIQAGESAVTTGPDSVIFCGVETDIIKDTDTGNWYISMESTDSGVYYINTGTIVYGSEDNLSASDNTTGLVLNGGNLTMKSSLNDNATEGIGVTKNSTITLKNGVLLNSSSLSVQNEATLTLSGNGTYALSTANLGTGVSLAEGANGWTGTVLLTAGTTLSATNIDDFANGTYSTVEFNGVSGNLCQANNTPQTYTANIKLTDNGSTFAFSSSDGFHGDVQIFSGKVSGSGTFARTGAGTTQTFHFTGDVSEWTGSFKATNTNTTATRPQNTIVEFLSDATTINTSVENSGTAVLDLNVTNDEAVRFSGAVTNTGTGTLNITTDGSGQKTFSGSISATSLTVNGGTTILTGSSTIDTVMVVGGSLILTSSNNTLTNVQIASGATLDASSCAEMGGSLSLGNGSELVISSSSGVSLCGSLTLGQNLTLTIVSLARTSTLSDEYSYALENGITLATGITSLEGIDWTETEAKNYISSLSINNTDISLDNAVLRYDSVGKTLTLTSATIPEPTAPVLSVLALGSLALRRRRHA